nr:AsnC family protein [Streptomyces sp. NRRL F-5755]
MISSPVSSWPRSGGRAPFARLAAAVGVFEHTVARRYRRLHTMGLRILGVPGRHPAGATRWLLRVSCTPDASAKIADALARRPDTAWGSIASGGTELHCAFATRTASERDALLLHKLPQTPRPSPSAPTACCTPSKAPPTPGTSRSANTRETKTGPRRPRRRRRPRQRTPGWMPWTSSSWPNWPRTAALPSPNSPAPRAAPPPASPGGSTTCARGTAARR